MGRKSYRQRTRTAHTILSVSVVMHVYIMAYRHCHLLAPHLNPKTQLIHTYLLQTPIIRTNLY